jgi:hypothetical protein
MSDIIYIEKTDIGATLTTWIYCAFWQMWAAEQVGREVYINWPNGASPGRCLQPYIDSDKFSELPNMYDWYFRQPKVQSSPPRNECEIWTWENWADQSPVPFMAQPLHVIKDYYNRNLHFSDVVNQRGQAIVDKYKIDFSNTIGVTWRGTDNVTDGRPRLSISTYFPFIDDILVQHPRMRIMATAEEETILDPLFERYHQAFKVDEFYSSPLGHAQNPERFSPLSGFERGMQPALMVWLFSKCAHYVKNRSSTGAVASWLSNGRIVSIFHPENLGFPANTDTIEIEGKQYSVENKLIE